MLGQPIDLAAKLAATYGMDADALIVWGKEQVRSAQAKQQEINSADHQDTDGPGAPESEKHSGANGAEVGEKATV